MGSLPMLTQHVIQNTKRIKVGPIGYVLPGWNPLRLALEIAWLDQLTKGRTIVGFARGYQARWLNQMAQKIHVSATASDKSETDRVNREVFEEVFQFLKLAWGDEPFRFKGKHYQYPTPQEGTPWPAAEWTREYGFPGEVDEQGRIQKINVVPKPYQRPHPPLFQAFSISEETVRWCAREGIQSDDHPAAAGNCAQARRGLSGGIAQGGTQSEAGREHRRPPRSSLRRDPRKGAQTGRAGNLRARLQRVLSSFRLYRGLARAGR